jgi:ABC-type Zn uptake system ZnuABC Zn-binding protein ZnuA
MRKYLISLLVLLLSISGCSRQTTQGLKIVATTTIVGDIVRQIGGDRISLTVLLPVGADPHTYEPRPQDVAAIHDAQVVFLNGLELEHSIEPIIAANAIGKVVEVSDEIEALPFSGLSGDEEHTAGDPHVWMDPNNVIQWVEKIRSALTEIDPAGADYYQNNADTYVGKLAELDQWIQLETAKIPSINKKLVTDHQSLGYFSKRYGFEQAGLLLPSLSTNASISASDLAQVEEVIQSTGIKTIFIEMGANDTLAAQVAGDTGVRIGRIYTGSLGIADSGASTYLDFMRFNTSVLVNGLQD